MNFIFDFDGTLMDTSNVILATIKATIKDLKLPERTDQECRSIIGIRTDEAGHYLFPNSNISDAEFAKTFRNNYEKIKRNALEKTFPGVIPTLNRLYTQGHHFAIASSRRLSSLAAYLNGLDIVEWFDMVVGADNVTKGKPDPEPVLKILGALKWDPKETIVVGDADVDIMMGNGAGCHTCAVTYGNGSLESLKKASPSYIIDSIDKLLDIEL